MTETPSKWAMQKARPVAGWADLDRRVDETARALAAYDATNAPAEPADTPQADIPVSVAPEGGSGETKTFARGEPKCPKCGMKGPDAACSDPWCEGPLMAHDPNEPLTWNVMGDGR